MAADQRNNQLWKYVDDGGNEWAKRGLVNTAVNAVDGSAAFTAGKPVFPSGSKRFHCRRAVFQDVTTFRTISFPVYSAGAFATIKATPPTLAIHVEGETATVNYTLSELIPERLPVAKGGRTLVDHA
jgi:hypothetical protein